MNHLVASIFGALPPLSTSSLQPEHPPTLSWSLPLSRHGAETLPRVVKGIAANQGTTSETASVMGAKKRTHTDTYGAGQASGKFTGLDARTAQQPPQPSVSNDHFNDAIDDLSPSPAVSRGTACLFHPTHFCAERAARPRRHVPAGCTPADFL
ncbi:hypothetical protein C8R47DRAFT_1072494 [Mycena vitilis]|nr:hypothetical protein C8R47DRAFT_1072494 [Mycena vitilis]